MNAFAILCKITIITIIHWCSSNQLQRRPIIRIDRGTIASGNAIGGHCWDIVWIHIKATTPLRIATLITSMFDGVRFLWCQVEERVRGNGGVASVWIHSQGWRTWGLGKTACGSGIFLHVPVSCASIQWAKEVAVVIVATDCSIWGGLIGASKACCPFEMVLMFRLFSWIFGLEGSRNWKKKENLLFKEKGRKTKYPESDRKWIQYLRSVLPLR